MSGRTTDVIPESLRRDLAQATKDYSVCILGAVNDPDAGHFKFCGSGTLVRSNGGYHVLSAAHVWKEVESCEGLGLTIAEYPHSFIWPTQVFEPHCLQGAEFGEWGPDLVLVRIPPNLVADIDARKSFYNLDLRRDKARDRTLVPAGERAIWAIVGAPGEMSKVVRREALMTMATFFSEVVAIHRKPDHDYYDMRVLDSARVSIPGRLGGVSGGGLWAFPVETLGDGSSRWGGQSILAGVAFYQTEDRDDQRNIRCHGPMSLYESFLTDSG